MTEAMTWDRLVGDARARAAGFKPGMQMGLPNTQTLYVPRVLARERHTEIRLRDSVRTGHTTLRALRRDGVPRDLAPMRAFSFRRNQQNFPGYYMCSTTGEWLRCESRHEVGFAIVADFRPDVAFINAQPFTIQAEVHLDGIEVLRRHTPDFLLTMTDGSLRVVNVTIPARAHTPYAETSNGWVRSVVEDAGMAFDLWVGVRKQYFENVSFLASFRHEPSRRQRDRMQQVTGSVRPGGSTVRDVLDRCSRSESDEAAVLQGLWGAMWRHTIVADLGAPIYESTVLYPGDGAA